MNGVVPTLIVMLTVLAGACNSSPDQPSETTTAEGSTTDLPVATAPSSSDDPAVTATVADPTTLPPVAPQPLDVRELVGALAADELAGRLPGSEGSRLAQRILIDELSTFAQPVYPDREGDEGFLQPFDEGTNVLALIPGGDLADEYVIIGAHYDHLGEDCFTTDPDDVICNGATDNATGVAAAVEIARTIAAEGGPRRSVIVALWDAEEIGLRGSGSYADDPVVPLGQTVAYLNFDVAGANLLPSLANTTILVGAETGGERLVEAATRATGSSTLDTVGLSSVFGQGRSDHAVFVDAGVPAAFFTDYTSACYHTSQDDVGVVDFDKLDQQIVVGTVLARELIATDMPPVFEPAAPFSAYDDAVSLLFMVSTAQPDLGLFDPNTAALIEAQQAQLEAIVAAGPGAFDDTAAGLFMESAATLIDAVTHTECV